MEENIGKICPFCKTEIKEGDAVKVCPVCGIPHHESCWAENKGCTTFGCSEQHYEEQHTNPTDVCVNCGAPLGDGQDFCPKCGTPKGGVKRNICGKCGAELQEGQEFCPKCGQRAGLGIDAGVSMAINQFNAGLEKKKRKFKVLPVVLAVVLVIAVAVGFFVHDSVQKKKAEEAKKAEELAIKEYKSNADAFLGLMITSGVNLENIADTVQRYWHENIWDDKHGSDINSAIAMAMIVKSDEISQAESYDTEIKTLYAKLKNVPKNIREENADDIEEIREAVKELYKVYTDFYELATNPSGSYNSYSDKNSRTTDDFLSAYRSLKDLLE